MTVTGRVPLLLLAGVLALVVRPVGSTAAWWVLAVALLVGLDVLLAPRPGQLEVTRRPGAAPVRQGQTTSTALVVANPGRRRVRGLLRDAWQPSAGATGNRHRLDLSPGDQVLQSAVDSVPVPR